ncbi:MAG: phosphatase PAP2 family protein [Proteobacteria bacterium]|nr:phosphatase PAP2 family protein [Pseudomonadota bacterium]
MHFSRIQTCVLLLAFLVWRPAPSIASPYELIAEREALFLLSSVPLIYFGSQNEKKKKPTDQDLADLDTSDIPDYDRSYAGRWNEAASTESDILLLAGIMLPGGFVFSERSDMTTLGIMYLEMVALTYGGVDYAKGTNTRYRPYAYGDAAPLEEKRDRDVTRSFFSGHAAHIAAGFVFSATVFADYYPDSKYISTVWTGAIVSSVYGSWARVRAGKHFPSDVLTGFIWGGLVGYAVPAFHRKDAAGGNRLQILPFISEREKGVSIVFNC